MVEDLLQCKTTLTVNTITMKAANTSQSKSTWNPDECTYQKHCQLPWERRRSLLLTPLLHLIALNCKNLLLHQGNIP